MHKTLRLSLTLIHWETFAVSGGLSAFIYWMTHGAQINICFCPFLSPPFHAHSTAFRTFISVRPESNILITAIKLRLEFCCDGMALTKCPVHPVHPTAHTHFKLNCRCQRSRLLREIGFENERRNEEWGDINSTKYALSLSIAQRPALMKEVERKNRFEMWLNDFSKVSCHFVLASPLCIVCEGRVTATSVCRRTLWVLKI